MSLKITVGPGDSIESLGEAVYKNQYLKSNFLYITTLNNGVSGNLNAPPSRILASEVYDTLEANPNKIIGLINYQKITNDNGDLISTQYGEGVTNIAKGLFAVSIYKKEVWYDENTGESFEEPLWTPVSTYQETGSTIRDFNIANNRNYKYVFRTINNNIESIGGSTAFVQTRWTGWSITELHPTGEEGIYTAYPKDVWRFKYNISSGSQTQNISKTQQENLSRFPTFSAGAKNAISGSVTCLLGREIINADYTNSSYKYIYDNTKKKWVWEKVADGSLRNIGGYRESLGRYVGDCDNQDYLTASDMGFKNLTSNESVDMLNEWRNVCFSGNPKLLKDEKGQSFIVQITDPSIEIKEQMQGMPTEISFSWVQIADAENCSITQEHIV